MPRSATASQALALSRALTTNAHIFTDTSTSSCTLISISQLALLFNVVSNEWFVHAHVGYETRTLTPQQQHTQHTHSAHKAVPYLCRVRITDARTHAQPSQCKISHVLSYFSPLLHSSIRIQRPWRAGAARGPEHQQYDRCHQRRCYSSQRCLSCASAIERRHSLV